MRGPPGWHTEQSPESTHPSPDRPPPTFLELNLQDVRVAGAFGRVLSLCVEAGRCVVLTKDRKRLVTWGAQSQAMPCWSPDTLHPTSPGLGGCWLPTPQHCPARLPAPSPEPSPTARGLGDKGLEKSDNFSPQLDLIFFFDAPTAGGRIAGEEQVRQEKCDFGGARRHWRASRERACTLGTGAYSALTAKLMTARDPSRCSSEPSRPWGPRG